MVTESEVVETLKKVIDYETGIDVYTMGLIRDLKVEDDTVSLTFVPSSPFCPLGIQLAVAIKKALSEVEGVKNVDITVRGHIQEKQINELLRAEMPTDR